MPSLLLLLLFGEVVGRSNVSSMVDSNIIIPRAAQHVLHCEDDDTDDEE